jgi:hypothetical protein
MGGGEGTYQEKGKRRKEERKEGGGGGGGGGGTCDKVQHPPRHRNLVQNVFCACVSCGVENFNRFGLDRPPTEKSLADGAPPREALFSNHIGDQGPSAGAGARICSDIGSSLFFQFRGLRLQSNNALQLLHRIDLSRTNANCPLPSNRRRCI